MGRYSPWILELFNLSLKGLIRWKPGMHPVSINCAMTNSESFFVWESVLIKKILIYTKKEHTNINGRKPCQNTMQFEFPRFLPAASGRSDACQRARG